MEESDKNRGGDVRTEEGGEIVPDSKVNAPELVNTMDFVATEKTVDLTIGRGVHKKNAEANTKVYDLTEKTMQARDV